MSNFKKLKKIYDKTQINFFLSVLLDKRKFKQIAEKFE